jgi:hypothetical protein
MPAFNRTYRQKIIDEYLNDTGRNSFVPSEFLVWLKPQEDHRAWSIFWGKDDAEAAHQYRIMLARQFVAGLRITVNVSETVAVKVPAFISPVANRREGGGYVSVDVTERDTTDELLRQASDDLRRWIKRYAGVLEIANVDFAAVETVMGAIEVIANEDNNEEEAA